MTPRVSLVIPTRGSTAVVRGTEVNMIANLLELLAAAEHGVGTEYVVVADDDVPDSYLDPARARLGEQLQVIGYRPPFNFSAKVNAGVAAARGEVVILLNDDMEPITGDWLERLYELASRPDVGAVGARLRYEDDTIQHAGIQFEPTEVYNISAGKAISELGIDDFLDRRVHAVTGACLAQRRAVWEQLGGLDESLANNFNDVEYCHRIAQAGLAVVQANSVELYHFESKTRQPAVTAAEVAVVMAVLAEATAADAEVGGPATTPPDPAPAPGPGIGNWLLRHSAILRSLRFEGWRATLAKLDPRR